MALTKIISEMTNHTVLPVSSGIQFPATQVASAGANVLDDYEEGTFTPIITSTAGSITSYTSSGEYTKVGRFVHIRMEFQVVTLGTASGHFLLGGLPFVCAAFQSTAHREYAVTGLTWALTLDAGGTGGIFHKYDNGTTVAASLRLPASFSYRV